MLAKDIMTSNVITVGPEICIRDVARLLASHGVSAVPVVDENSVPIGMVSEGDLIGHGDIEKTEKQDWWLSILAEGEELSAEYLRSIQPSRRAAADVMTTPVVSVREATDIHEIAQLLNNYHIKRVPVLRDNRIVGIVSRADLVRALAGARDDAKEVSSNGAAGYLMKAIAGIDHRYRPKGLAKSSQVVTPASAPNHAISAHMFRDMVAKYHDSEIHHRQAMDSAAAEARASMVNELTEHHVDNALWRTSLEQALTAAEHGANEFQLLRFPAALCCDGGRAINAPEASWPKSLRGEAAEFYLRWEHELKPHGFGLHARVLEFPNGLPGDIGLFLSWQSPTAN